MLCVDEMKTRNYHYADHYNIQACNDKDLNSDDNNDTVDFDDNFPHNDNDNDDPKMSVCVLINGHFIDMWLSVLKMLLTQCRSVSDM